jgi:hypothetical protein
MACQGWGHGRRSKIYIKFIKKYKAVATVETGKNTVDIASAYRGKIH